MIKFTAIIVTYNEESHLDECLSALNFCQEKIVIDLGSSDKSVEIAKKNNCKVIFHERVEIVEQIREWAIQQANNQWIVFMDPDEIFPKESLLEIINMIEKDKVGGVTFERTNFFLGRPIKHGRWFGKSGYPRVINKNSVILSGSVHDGLKRKREYKYKKSKSVIKHYWIDNLEQFYEKHNRYLKFEGESRYKRGLRFSSFKMFKSLSVNFVMWFFVNHGFLDTKNGWLLIKLAIWYEKQAWLSLKKYQEDIIK